MVRETSRYKVSIFGEYQFGGDLTGWRAGLGFIHVGERFGDNANTFELPTYERVDLNVGYERGPFKFSATVENLFNETYAVGTNGRATNVLQGPRRFFTINAGYAF